VISLKKKGVGGIGSNYIPLGFHETLLFKANPVAPTAEVIVTSTAPSNLRVTPSTFTFQAGKVTYLFVQVAGASLTTGPVTVTFSSNSSDPVYNNFVASFTVEVIRNF